MTVPVARLTQRQLNRATLHRQLLLRRETLTAPAAGSRISRTIIVTATASDNIGVAGVQFLLDGTPLGAEDTTTPYSVAWDTTTASTSTATERRS
jgi:hypothetical protein